MEAKYINPFIKAVQNLFTTMIEIPFQLEKPELKKEASAPYEVSSIIGLSGGVVGCVVVSLSETVALQLASVLTGETLTKVDADLTDAIGEIANMIAGNAKTDFPSENCSISVPSVVVGRHNISYPSGIPIISIPCKTDKGPLVIEVALKVMEV